MKFSTTFLALCLAGANAFSTRPAAFGVGKRLMMSDSLAEPEVAAVEDDGEAATDAPAAEPTPAAPTPPAPLSGLRMKDVRKAVDSLDKDNFSQTLDELESFLTHEAGSSLYAKSMRRLNVRAQALGLEIPADYAKEAKATQKKREKQNSFIQVKEEERLAAEAAPAEDAPAEEETEAPAEEDEAPVEA